MVGAFPSIPEDLEQTDSVEAKTPIFNRYSLVAPASAVTASEKVQLSIIERPLRASNEPKINIVRCP